MCCFSTTASKAIVHAPLAPPPPPYLAGLAVNAHHIALVLKVLFHILTKGLDDVQRWRVVVVEWVASDKWEGLLDRVLALRAQVVDLVVILVLGLKEALQ